MMMMSTCRTHSPRLRRSLRWSVWRRPPQPRAWTRPPWMDVGGVPSDAEVTDSGLAYKVLQEGTGSRRPNRLSTVSVHYTGWLTNGTLFDSSVPTGRPATFPLNRVIGGWTEGVQMMVVGEKRRFWIPAELGYGDRGFQNLIPGGALLVFDIELVNIQ